MIILCTIRTLLSVTPVIYTLLLVLIDVPCMRPPNNHKLSISRYIKGSLIQREVLAVHTRKMNVVARN